MNQAKNAQHFTITLHQDSVKAFQDKKFKNALVNLQLMLASSLATSPEEHSRHINMDLSRDLVHLRHSNDIFKSKIITNTVTSFKRSMFDEGFDKLTEILDADETSCKDSSIIYYNLGKTHENIGNYLDALESYFNAIPGAERRLERDPSDCFLLVATLRSIGKIYYLHGRFVDSLSAYSIALKVNVRGHRKTENIESASILCSIGVLQMICGNDSAFGANQLEESFRIMNAILDYDHLDIATIHNNLGRCYFKQGNYGHALSSFKEALRIRVKEYGEGHQDVAVTIYNLGKVYHHMGEMSLAHEFYSKFVRISRVNTWCNPKAVDILHKIGDFYRGNKNNTLITTTFKTALQIELKLYGPESEQFARTLSKLGSSCIEADDYQSAKIVYEQELLIQSKIYGTNSTNALSTLIKLAYVLKQLKEYEESVNTYNQILQIQRITWQDTNIIFGTLINLGYLYQEIGDLHQAFSTFDEAIQLKEEGALSNNQVMHVLKEIVNILRELNMLQLAADYDLELIEMEKTFSSQEDLGFLYQRLSINASIYKNCQNYEKALICFERSLAIESYLLGPEHPDVAVSLCDIGEMYLMLGKRCSALEKFKEALCLLRNLHLDDDMFAANLMRDIGSLYRWFGNEERSVEMLDEASRIYRVVGVNDAIIVALTNGHINDAESAVLCAPAA